MGWKGTVKLRGQNGKIATMVFNLDVSGAITATPPDEMTEAVSIMAALEPALVAITDAVIAASSVSMSLTESGAMGAGDVFEKAVISAHINDTTLVQKVATLKVPAPAIGIFLGTTGTSRDKIDVADADLQTYATLFNAQLYVSDGEHLDPTGHANAGVIDGRRTAQSFKL